ncbi:hypothetical protein Dsin_011625 [Dipteronia sinensis]|uniref:Uncharacterized protein n=1 Tax=Dipteronia sinensis TaxID=43782 RepID=A0AAE0AH43_9ROSI|nr:hypothetical protein Dsin_011625 [Dipteronia sinensis]
MDFTNTADNIFAVILSVLETYGITHRILSITLDNASANTKSIALFTERNIPQAGGYFFHQRCACHIINLVVQSGLKKVSNRIERIRDAISWIGSSNPRFQEFGRHCTLNGLRLRRFQTDMPVRWNSTYLMLKNCLEYDTTISGFYNMKLAASGCPPAQSLTPDDWYVAKIFVEFLQITDIRNKLFEAFSIYERRFGGVHTEPSPEPDTQSLPTSWSILKRRKKDKSPSDSSSTT